MQVQKINNQASSNYSSSKANPKPNFGMSYTAEMKNYLAGKVSYLMEYANLSPSIFNPEPEIYNTGVQTLRRINELNAHPLKIGLLQVKGKVFAYLQSPTDPTKARAGYMHSENALDSPSFANDLVDDASEMVNRYDPFTTKEEIAKKIDELKTLNENFSTKILSEKMSEEDIVASLKEIKTCEDDLNDLKRRGIPPADFEKDFFNYDLS